MQNAFIKSVIVIQNSNIYSSCPMEENIRANSSYSQHRKIYDSKQQHRAIRLSYHTPSEYYENQRQFSSNISLSRSDRHMLPMHKTYENQRQLAPTYACLGAIGMLPMHMYKT